jgi:ribokinase
VVADDGRAVDVAVVGSLNLDITVPVDRLPLPGETVLGGDRSDAPGGKGANQAVAAARQGAATAMVGAVGDDAAGSALLAALTGDGVDVTAVRRVPGVASGTALVVVAPDGENQIVLAPGANRSLSGDDVLAAAPVLARAPVVCLQLEIGDDAVAAAARLAAGRLVLTPAPWRELPGEVLAAARVLVANRGEIGQLLGVPAPASVPEAGQLAARVRDRGPRAVAVTLGPAGVVLAIGGRPLHLPAPDVGVVDATGAGDTFAGVLAAGLSRGLDTIAAARRAVVAASLSTTRPGAQSAMPTAAAVDALVT